MSRLNKTAIKNLLRLHGLRLCRPYNYGAWSHALVAAGDRGLMYDRLSIKKRRPRFWVLESREPVPTEPTAALIHHIEDCAQWRSENTGVL